MSNAVLQNQFGKGSIQHGICRPQCRYQGIPRCTHMKRLHLVLRSFNFSDLYLARGDAIEKMMQRAYDCMEASTTYNRN